jgi:hypothetical protein
MLASGDMAVTLYFFVRFALISANTLNASEGGHRWSKILMNTQIFLVHCGHVGNDGVWYVGYLTASTSGLLVRKSPN